MINVMNRENEVLGGWGVGRCVLAQRRWAGQELKTAIWS